MLSRQFKQRLLISCLGILGLVISIYYSYTSFFKPLFILLCMGIVSLALFEYYRLARHKGFQPSELFGIGFSILYIFALSLSFHHPSFHSLPSFILLISLLALFLIFFKQQTAALGNLAITLFGIGYLTIPLSCALRINYFFPLHALEDGRLWLAYVLLISKITDIGAYFCGKILGKTLLAPSISPKKTIEGAIGGAITALVTSLLFTLFASHLTLFKMTLFQSLWLGLIISMLAQLGDLAESLLKRDAGVKDSSHLPGLGGVLDIVDSLVFPLPLMYLFLQMHIVG
jgi:phosphatidate cytidylyltransferase